MTTAVPHNVHDGLATPPLVICPDCCVWCVCVCVGGASSRRISPAGPDLHVVPPTVEPPSRMSGRTRRGSAAAVTVAAAATKERPAKKTGAATAVTRAAQKHAAGAAKRKDVVATDAATAAAKKSIAMEGKAAIKRKAVEPVAKTLAVAKLSRKKTAGALVVAAFDQVPEAMAAGAVEADGLVATARVRSTVSKRKKATAEKRKPVSEDDTSMPAVDELVNSFDSASGTSPPPSPPPLPQPIHFCTTRHSILTGWILAGSRC